MSAFHRMLHRLEGIRRRANPFAPLVSLEIPEGLESLDLDPYGGIEDCLSLVSLYAPPSQDLQPLRDFMEDFQLAKVATGWKDLLPNLKRRFDGLRFHKISPFTAIILNTGNQRYSDCRPKHSIPNGCCWDDSTTHYIAGPKARSGTDPGFAEMVLSPKDLFGSTAVDYLCKNPLEEGLLAARWMIRKILPFLGLDEWKQDVLETEEVGRRHIN